MNYMVDICSFATWLWDVTIHILTIKDCHIQFITEHCDIITDFSCIMYI